MRKFTILSVWGIPIRVGISLLVFLPVLTWLIASGAQIEVYAGLIEGLTGRGFDLDVLQAGSTPWIIGATAAVGLFFSVTLHELGHSWVALRYGVKIESITLWILGGIAALESIPKEWNREFWIAIAGPVVSLATGVAFYGATLAVPDSLPVVRFVLGWLAVVNVTLVVFNLLPAFPMDGGRILRALLARSRPYGSATRIAARIGVVFALLFAVVGVFGRSPLLVLLALFVYGAAKSESRAVMLDELLGGLTVGDIMSREADGVSRDTPVEDLVNRMIRERRTVYPVVEAGETVGVVTLGDLKGQRENRESARVGDVIREVPRLEATSTAFDAMMALGAARASTALVVEDGRVTGLLSEEDFAHALTVQRGFQSGAF